MKSLLAISLLFSLVILSGIATAQPQAPCNTGADNDTVNIGVADCDGTVDIDELLAYIDLWYGSFACYPDIFQAVEAWFAGQQPYVPDCSGGNVCGTSGNTYHVDATGGRDYTTIGACAAATQPGDTCLIHAGAYAEASSPRPNSGTAAEPVTFMAAGDGQVTVTASEYCFNLDNRDYVVIDGLTFNTYGSETCIRMNNADHNKVLNSEFLDFPSGAYKDSIEIMRNSNYNLIEGNTFGAVNHNSIFIQGRESGVFATHNIVRNNVCDSPEHRCLGIHQTSRTLVEGNEFTGTADQFIQFEGPDTIMRNNLFYGYVDFSGEREQDGAIRLWSADADYYGNPVIAQRNRVYNNVFYNNEKVHGNHGTLGPNPVTDNIFKNNIYYQNQETIDLDMPDYQTVNQNYFISNIIYGTDAGQSVIVLNGDSYTVASAQSNMPSLYNGNLDEVPLFVNAGNADFSLQQASQAIDAGADLTYTTGAGTGTVIPVGDALYFMDGWDVIEADMVQVGPNSPVRVTDVDYGNNQITVETAISWNNGDRVNLPYLNNAPDIGAIEYDGVIVTICDTDPECDDGQYCNGQETCNAGVCAAGTDPCPEDSYSCTTVSCNEGVDSCSVSRSDPACDDQDPCTDDTCEGDGGDAGTGCSHPFNIAPCDDGIACTTGDACSDGACLTGAPDDSLCRDVDCTNSICHAATGCEYLPIGC
jgi:hypothetical protein